VVSSFERIPGVDFRYLWNHPSLGQANNINRLYRQARGERALLLHDDDLLLAGAVDVLVACCVGHADIGAVYGKHMIITADGRPLPADSDELNHYYHRTSRDEGSKLAPIEAGLLQQFPNDGFLVETKLARQIPLQTRDKVGDMCDMDFGVRLGPIAKRFYFVNQFTAKYRLTSGLTLSANVTPAHLFRRLDEYPVPAESEWGRDAALSRLAPQAVVEYVNLGERKKAMQLYVSKHHPLRRRLSPGGLRRLAAIVFDHPKSKTA